MKLHENYFKDETGLLAILRDVFPNRTAQNDRETLKLMDKQVADIFGDILLKDFKDVLCWVGEVVKERFPYHAGKFQHVMLVSMSKSFLRMNTQLTDALPGIIQNVIDGTASSEFGKEISIKKTQLESLLLRLGEIEARMVAGENKEKLDEIQKELVALSPVI